MAKRWRKQKAGQQASRKRRPGGTPGEGTTSGTLASMRKGARGLVGGSGKPKSSFGKLLDAASWVAIAILGGIFIVRQCGQ